MAWNPFTKKEEPVEKKDGEQGKADMDALVEKLGASIETRFFKPLSDKVEAMQSKWADLEKVASTPTNADGTPIQPTDEEKAKGERQAAIGIAVQANARMTENEVLQSVSADFPDHVAKIRSHFANTPIQRKALPDYPIYCENIVNMVLGQAARENGMRYSKQNSSFFLEDKSTSATREEGPLSDPNLEWNQVKGDGSIKHWTVADQLRALQIDPKELAENMKRGVV